MLSQASVGFCSPFIKGGCAAEGTFTSTPSIETYPEPPEFPVYDYRAPGSPHSFSLPQAGVWTAIWHIKHGVYSIAISRILNVVESQKCNIGWEEVPDSADPSGV